MKKANWNLSLPLDVAMRDYPECIVSLSDSQVLRFIDELNGRTDLDDEIRNLQYQIKMMKKQPRTPQTGRMMEELYDKLYYLQFHPDYLCVVMDSNKDYDRANKGFSINGITYRRFLGTSGGIKNSTIVYVSDRLYPELKRRLDNGRKMDVPLVPAKLEAYQALVCSGSTPLPPPKGFIVVKDCITHFTDDVILINDETDGEPLLTYEKDYPIEHNDSDGYGLMLPSYSRKVNEFLHGDSSKTISGMNTRYAWSKGMVYTFDFVEFAEKVAGTYEIIDIWGMKRDVRDAEVILTESMLKLWNCYSCWEEYYQNCEENHYQFSITKETPEELECERTTNYQFLQSYQFSKEELENLCEPTYTEISEVLGLDYRKTLAFLTGGVANHKNIFGSSYETYVKALMIEPRMICDPFVKRKVWNLIAKRIEAAKRGVIKVHGNYAMISGDPYALCQSMFDLEITGLLKAGECYHKYWIDNHSEKIVCFRAPMTCHNNIRTLNLCYSEETAHWYQYIKTALILNAWDTTCDALNGEDKDGDTNMCTDNPILIHNTLNSPTIICIQKKAEKIIVTEEDIIAANKLGFNDEIGIVTNHVTSMIERQAGFLPDSDEYKTLAYRIMCGQHYQQCTIDRIKGIVAKPMPEYWYSKRDCAIHDEDNEETKNLKEYNMSIVASQKPYFMIYVYPALRTKYLKYLKNCESGAVRRFSEYKIDSLQSLFDYDDKTEEMEDYLSYFEKNMPTGNNDCVVNEICRYYENHFSGFSSVKNLGGEFDYSVMKSNAEYSEDTFKKIEKLYKNYLLRIDSYHRKMRYERHDETDWVARFSLIQSFSKECLTICSNEKELCNILIDLCYKTESSKQFAWDICGETIVSNLLEKHHSEYQYPVKVFSNEDFSYCGEKYVMEKEIVQENVNEDYSE